MNCLTQVCKKQSGQNSPLALIKHHWIYSLIGVVWRRKKGVNGNRSLEGGRRSHPCCKTHFDQHHNQGSTACVLEAENSPQFCQHILQWKKLSSIQIRRSSWSHATFYHLPNLYSSNTTPRGVMQPLWSQGVSLF